MTFQELTTVAPFVAAILTAIAIMIVDLAWPNRSALAVGTALIGLAITAALVIVVGGTTQLAFGGTYKVDALTTFLQLLLIGIVALSIVFGPDYLGPRNLPTSPRCWFLPSPARC
jgi:NADH:ubiquinone oxidoreductase subunit 2 (subunit N)